MNSQLISLMKECGFWDQHSMDKQNSKVQGYLANLHHYCRKHKEVKNGR